MKRPIGVLVEGCIYTDNGTDLSHEEFLNAFIEFVESNGWHFGGGSCQIDEEGKKIDDIE